VVGYLRTDLKEQRYDDSYFRGGEILLISDILINGQKNIKLLFDRFEQISVVQTCEF